MTPDQLTPCVVINREAPSIGSLLANLQRYELSPINHYDLNDLLYRSVGAMPAGSFVNSNELYKLRAQFLVTHRKSNGELYVLMQSNNPDDNIPWKAGFMPTIDMLSEAGRSVHNLLEASLTAVICNLGITTNDTPTKREVALPYEAIRESMDAVVVGIAPFKRISERSVGETHTWELHVEGCYTVKPALFDYMVEKGYGWWQVTDKMEVVDRNDEIRGYNHSPLINYIREVGYLKAVVMNPGLE